MAGEIVMREAAKNGVRVLAVDSEHSAIFNVSTASPPRPSAVFGSPLPAGRFLSSQIRIRRHHRGARAQTSVVGHGPQNHDRFCDALQQGPRDDRSALAFRRRDGPRQRRRASISVVHSMVEFVDGSIIAQLSTPDMCLPIQYASRTPTAHVVNVYKRTMKLGSLTFEEPDTERFPRTLARRAGEVGGTLPRAQRSEQSRRRCFLRRQNQFPADHRDGRAHDGRAQVSEHPTLKEILEADAWARQEAAR